jgi:hypothetical protein
MTEPAVREPDDIRRDCARKIRQVETSGFFTAVLACLLGEEWTTPRIEQLCVTSDGHLLARGEGQAGYDIYIGSAMELVKNIHGLAPVAGLDGDELGYLLGRVASLKGPP